VILLQVLVDGMLHNYDACGIYHIVVGGRSAVSRTEQNHTTKMQFGYISYVHIVEMIAKLIYERQRR
jgi:hypothetical protein